MSLNKPQGIKIDVGECPYVLHDCAENSQYNNVENFGNPHWLDTSEIDEAKMSDKDEAYYALAESQIGASQDLIKPAKDRQEGGDHYKSMAIQPYEYCQKNNLGYCESNVIKYVSRWKNKDGIKDLKKARHMLDLLIEENE